MMSFRIDDILKKESSLKKCAVNVDEHIAIDYTTRSSINYSQFSTIQENNFSCWRNRHLPDLNCYSFQQSFKETQYLPRFLRLYEYMNLQRRSLPQEYYSTARQEYSSTMRPKTWEESTSTDNIYSYHFNRQHNLSKRKGGQVRFNPHQTDTLEKQFISKKYLPPGERKLLAENLKLSDRQVKTWFQNRRAKWRRSLSTENDSSGMSQ